MLSVPRIIWQTHEYKWEDLPINYKKTAMSWINLNPGWKYRYVDKDERLEWVSGLAPEIAELFSGPQGNPFTYGMGQADAFRYLIVNRMGGAYCDMDSFCTTPLDYILENTDSNIDIVTNKQNGLINNSNFISKPVSPLLMDTIRIIKDQGSMADPLQAFRIVTTDHPNVSLNFEVKHSEMLKEDFDPNFTIDYYGKSIKYKDYIRDNELKIS